MLRGQRCYRYVNSPMTWTSAQAFCRADVRGKGTDLATITSAAENEFVLRQMQAYPGWTRRKHWNSLIGCNSIDKKGTWLWSGEQGRALCTAEKSGECVPEYANFGAFTNWAAGEPDLDSPRGPENICLMMDNDYPRTNCASAAIARRIITYEYPAMTSGTGQVLNCGLPLHGHPCAHPMCGASQSPN